LSSSVGSGEGDGDGETVTFDGIEDGLVDGCWLSIVVAVSPWMLSDSVSDVSEGKSTLTDSGKSEIALSAL
jgi:hypothetical protein